MNEVQKVLTDEIGGNKDDWKDGGLDRIVFREFRSDQCLGI